MAEYGLTAGRDVGRSHSLRTGSWVGLAIVQGFVALTAIGGGLALVGGLEAANDGPELLAGTPFTDYVVPGLLLAIAVGGSAAAATVATVRRPRQTGSPAVGAGVVLIGWIVGEMLLLDQPTEPIAIEAIYLAAGLLLAILGSVRWHGSRVGP